MFAFNVLSYLLLITNHINAQVDSTKNQRPIGATVLSGSYVHVEKSFYENKEISEATRGKYSFVYKYSLEAPELAKVELGWSKGFIDRNENELIPTIYNDIKVIYTNDLNREDSSQYVFVYQKENECGFLSKTGKPISSFEIKYINFWTFDYIGNGWFSYKDGSYWGIIDTLGKIIAPASLIDDFRFDTLNRFVKVQGKNGFYGVINKKGKVVIPWNRFVDLQYHPQINKGIFMVYDDDIDKVGVLNHKGKWIIKPKEYDYLLIWPRELNDLSESFNGSKIAYIDKNGKLIKE